MARQSTGKRLRFEILKRDGFKCRYCGRTALAAQLHVDHVLPLAEGGTNIPENLAAACADCNGGKSSVPLDESELATSPAVDAMREHAEQVSELLSAAYDLEQEKLRVLNFVAYLYKQTTGRDVPTLLSRGLRGAIERHSLAEIERAFGAVASKLGYADMDAEDETKYFFGCLRRLRDAR